MINDLLLFLNNKYIFPKKYVNFPKSATNPQFPQTALLFIWPIRQHHQYNFSWQHWKHFAPLWWQHRFCYDYFVIFFNKIIKTSKNSKNQALRHLKTSKMSDDDRDIDVESDVSGMEQWKILWHICWNWV